MLGGFTDPYVVVLFGPPGVAPTNIGGYGYRDQVSESFTTQFAETLGRESERVTAQEGSIYSDSRSTGAG